MDIRRAPKAERGGVFARTDLSISPNNQSAPSSWDLTVEYAVISDVGMRRSVNQDSAVVVPAATKELWEKLGHLFVVADGMGAHAAGELASRLAVELIPHHYRKMQGMIPAEAIRRAVSESNAEIFRRGQANIEFRNMGTTTSLLVLLPEGAVVAHVGDSRVYQLHGEKLYQLTFDHSLVWEMQAAGEVSDETARSGVIPKNVITRSLGPNATVHIDIEGPFPVKVGDRFLLCSDGLSGQITDEEIGALLKAIPVKQAAQLFVDLSNLRGGPDNITAVVIEVVDNAIANQNSGPIVPRRAEKKSAKFSPVFGVVSAACLIAAALLAYSEAWAVAIVSCVLGSIALLTGLWQMLGSSEVTDDVTLRYGRGPYRQYKAAPSLVLFEHLAGTMKALREAAEERKWNIDWPRFEGLFKVAKSAADKGDFVTAIREQAQLIIDLMAQIRNQRLSSASDSSVDL